MRIIERQSWKIVLEVIFIGVGLALTVVGSPGEKADDEKGDDCE